NRGDIQTAPTRANDSPRCIKPPLLLPISPVKPLFAEVCSSLPPSGCRPDLATSGPVAGRYFRKKSCCAPVVLCYISCSVSPGSGADSITCGTDNWPPSGSRINGSALQVAGLGHITIYARKKF